MTKWVKDKDVVFTCQKDIFAHLAKGGVVRHNETGHCVYFQDGHIGNWLFDNFKEWTPIKRAEWYEDIPEKGVLCWVGNSTHAINKQFLSIIINKEDDIFYSSSGTWCSAIPLTKEEALQYILPD